MFLFVIFVVHDTPFQRPNTATKKSLFPSYVTPPSLGLYVDA